MSAGDLVVSLTVAFMLGWLCTGCHAPVCQTLASRCDGSRVELCDSRGQWTLVADCDAMTSGGEWTCGETVSAGETVAACLPEQP